MHIISASIPAALRFLFVERFHRLGDSYHLVHFSVVALLCHDDRIHNLIDYVKKT